MGVFTFVCRETGGAWSAKQLNGDLHASADKRFDLERKLVHAALAVGSSGAVQSSFSYVTPSSGVIQVIVGGASVGGGVAASTPAASSGDAVAETEDKNKEKEKDEESGEEDGFIFNLFE
ncbi:60S acidic ribosomal protein P3-1 [Striga hermonthica]|uniref:60S acidic ribosomal protein P3-1 n=1 Tax=Striga hermonthica TaxID=68872 RepID=A0A9N7R9M0_STRHE|nr:60S acidic ribosomal protein P3-1 [Striga hermonthica]